MKNNYKYNVCFPFFSFGQIMSKKKLWIQCFNFHFLLLDELCHKKIYEDDGAWLSIHLLAFGLRFILEFRYKVI
jgi:hypothetical protein